MEWNGTNWNGMERNGKLEVEWNGSGVDQYGMEMRPQSPEINERSFLRGGDQESTRK